MLYFLILFTGRWLVDLRLGSLFNCLDSPVQIYLVKCLPKQKNCASDAYQKIVGHFIYFRNYEKASTKYSDDTTPFLEKQCS